MIFNESTPKKYRKVKTVELQLCDENCVVGKRDIAVCMHSGGTPTFCVYVPPLYRDAWVNHRSKGNSFDDRRNIFIPEQDGWLHAPSFELVTERLGKMSENYRAYLTERTKEKVIALSLNLYIKGGNERQGFQIGELPSFSAPSVLVGLRSSVYWRVGGVLYRDDRKHWKAADEGPEDTDPAFSDLIKAERFDSNSIIPYTDAAWATVQAIEDTLRRAATMLRELKGDKAQAILEGGMKALMLSGSPVDEKA